MLFTRFPQTIHQGSLRRIFLRRHQYANLVTFIAFFYFLHQYCLLADQPPSYDQVVQTPIATPASPGIPVDATDGSQSRPPSFSQTQIVVPKPA